jgi:hypothetical protein
VGGGNALFSEMAAIHSARAHLRGFRAAGGERWRESMMFCRPAAACRALRPSLTSHASRATLGCAVERESAISEDDKEHECDSWSALYFRRNFWSESMALEFWDSKTKKYILYRNQQQHSRDCARFLLEDIPKRVFLDTNVINILIKHSENVFEHSRISSNIGTLAEDIEALAHIFYVGARANWDLVGAKKTLDELSRTPDDTLRYELLEYGVSLESTSGNRDDHEFASDFGRRLKDTHFVNALPDVGDRELIGAALALGCDAFCTCDRKTIVKKRDKLRKMPLRIVTPAEWWAHIKPWAGLWA